jgi:hypothetical protein
MIYSVIGAGFRDNRVYIRFFGTFDSLAAAEVGMQDRLLSCDKCWIYKSVLNASAPEDSSFVGTVGSSTAANTVLRRDNVTDPSVVLLYDNHENAAERIDRDSPKESLLGSDMEGDPELGHEHRAFFQSLLWRKERVGGDFLYN